MTEQAKGPTQNLVFAADLGGTNLRAATVDSEGKISSRVKYPTPHSAADAGEIVCAIVKAANECKEAARKIGITISSASVVVPGTVDITGKIVVQAPNVPCLDGFRLSDALGAQLGWPVLLENDANAASMGELWRGAARGCKTIICVTLGTGVGGGIIFNGQLWRGPDGSAGEIGHTTVDPFSGLKCKCGNTGCLELFASATGIVRMAREALPYYPKTILNAAQLNSQKIYEAGMQGDELALATLKKMGTYLGIGLANLINLLNPEMIVIGGGVANGWKLFEGYMHQEVEERAFPLPVQRARIVPAECGDDAGLLGAAHLALSKNS
ncbi:MAG TPA: ROK family protein [Pyrinomonadaceae bacterium]